MGNCAMTVLLWLRCGITHYYEEQNALLRNIRNKPGLSAVGIVWERSLHQDVCLVKPGGAQRVRLCVSGV